MAEFSLDRFKYRWRNTWTPTTAYRRDDIVRVNGKSYVCVIAHTSSDAFRTDLEAVLPGSSPPQPQPKWIVMTSGRAFVGDWITAEDYNKGDIVLKDGSLWLCIDAHQSTNFFNNFSFWAPFTLHIKYVGNWQASTEYGPGAVVKYNGIAYKCTNPHVSSSQLETNIDDWNEFHIGVEYRGAWTSGIEYRKNDYVRFGGSIFRCTETHTSAGSIIDTNRFTIELPGYRFNGEWSSTAQYATGDVVRYGGVIYYALQSSVDVDPSRFSNDSTVAWTPLIHGYNFRGNWSIDQAYKTGDLVLRGGELFVAIRDVNLSQGDGSSTDYLDPEVWEKLASGKQWTSAWSTDNLYSVGDVVYFLGTAYVCNEEHLSAIDNFPGDNGSGYAYWDILIQAGTPGGLRSKGDLLSYGLNRAEVGDGSSLGELNIPIGNETELLSINNDNEIFYRNLINDGEVVYVSNSGNDLTGAGTFLNPFKSVRHACEYVEDTLDSLTPAVVQVATGRFEEVGPISVPAGCVVQGDELRATKIVATPGFSTYQDDYQYVDEYLTYFTTFVFDLITSTPITYGYTNGTGQILNLPPSNSAGASAIASLIQDFRDYIEFRVDDGSVDPSVTGSNSPNADVNISNAAAILDANKTFIYNEFIARLQDQYPLVSFDEEKVQLDVNAFIRGLKRDLTFTGNYATIQAARRYANSVNGSQRDDLFYVRDTTGIRNCTVDGLTGDLNPQGVFDLYQRPTGGACVSLDPGWGPADERVWIVNRSPYIQGVTNIGTACVGQKVDGSLHNGGNKSITSNDFTQVLSDGIGAWVLNNARAELVSVFTYYCKVGYLAEDGGIIRATNGNNSYGDFGSIADGNDPTEIPQQVTVWNRNNEAQVEDAFTGGATDNIIALEYSHCGEDYSTATAEIEGAGNGASFVFDDFRDGAMFEARLINTTGSGSEGGSNYKIVQNNAQSTSSAEARIILNTNEATQFQSEIQGMRILIVSGTGAGQYGTIDTYDVVSKVCTVKRDYDDASGWDHINRGTPIESSLDSTTIYRIEPKVIANHPGFTSESADLSNARTFADIDFGGMTETFNNLTASVGTGDTFGGVPVAATFDVIRRGLVYDVSLNNTGSGYAVGDTITFLGTNLGGASPANDLTITVNSVTEDSTNSILSFTSSGTGREGRFVAIAQPNFIVYSDDGDSWTETNTTFSGTFKKLLAGNDIFVAVPENDNKVSFSYTGSTWITRSLPSNEKWVDGVYGDKFVIIAENSRNIAYSLDGLSWSQSTLPAGDDSSGDQWQAIAYGQNTYVAISGSSTKDVAYSTNGIAWNMYNNVLPAGDFNWVSLAYGANKFVALASDGSVAISLDKGETWIQGTTAPNNGDNPLVWKELKYSQGVFFAIGTLPEDIATDYCATTEDGIYWYERSMPTSQKWSALTFASLNNIGTWIGLADDSTTNGVGKMFTGAQVRVRANISQGSFANVKIWDPGSGYSISNPVSLTVTDTEFITEVETENRIGNGVISQPSFVDKGTGYRTSTTDITISGNGYAEIIPQENTLTLKGINVIPGPGVQIRITGVLDEATEDPTDLRLFTGVGVEDLGEDDSGNGTRLVQFTISPSLRNEYNLAHDTSATLRLRYSQCRISGHDFLDIGTGNFEDTNYPDIYADGNFFTAAPENEVFEANGGRVFYTSTDQNGNFRAGELFGVDQATGIVTISAEFFDLDGLSELALGGVRLGGSGTVVSEFSTDPTFSADSNNIIPTQRAIGTFLADRLSVGGSDLETNRLVAGTVSVGGADNELFAVGGGYLNIDRDVEFFTKDENGNNVGIQGTIISQMLFLRNFNDTIQ